jgi:probable HAF family extracellular repeat protein
MKTPFTNLFDTKLKAPLTLMLLVLLSCLVAPDSMAQGLRNFSAIPSLDRSQSQNLPAGQAWSQQRTRRIDGTGMIKHEKMDPDRDKLTTIPHWAGEFSYHGITYPYRIVGTDPGRGSATTVVPTFLVPLRFVFADGRVIDTSTDLVEGQTAIQGMRNSPVFQPYDFKPGGTAVGKTQYPDAFQRANFWKDVSTKAPDYHVLLGQPTVVPVQTITVPADKGGFYSDPSVIIPIPFVDYDFLDQHVRALISQLGISPQALPIFVTGRAFESFDGFFPSSGGYHDAFTTSAGNHTQPGAQTYVVTCYLSHQDPDLGSTPDVYPLSHEVNEWLDDPFINNFTPGWNLPFYPQEQCFSDIALGGDLLEVCDPLEFFLERSVALTGSSFTYHVAETVFLDFFTRAARSNSVNGQFSFFGVAPAASSPCTGHLEVEKTLFAFPGAVSTTGHGINNRGEVVGYYFDASFNRHGFSFDKNIFTSIDFPGATDTAAQKVNDSGLVVGWFDKADGAPHGFSYKNGVYATIDFPGSIDTIADGVNAEGDVVGGYDDTNFITHGFVLHNGRYLRTDAPYASQTQLSSINDKGQAAGFTWDDPINGPYLGLVRDGNTFSMISYPGAQFTYPFSINNSGMLTGQFFDADGINDGFVTVFGFPYAIYGYVFGNNDKGQIAGTTHNSAGQRVGFTAQLPTKSADH